MALHFAGCCHPLPGDRIVGIVTTGKGVTIHTIDCDTLGELRRRAGTLARRRLEQRRGRRGPCRPHQRHDRQRARQSRQPDDDDRQAGRQHQQPEDHQPLDRFLRDHGRYPGRRREAPDEHHRGLARDAGHQLGRARPRLSDGRDRGVSVRHGAGFEPGHALITTAPRSAGRSPRMTAAESQRLSDDPRRRQRPDRHPPHREGDRALRRPLSRPHLHRDRAPPLRPARRNPRPQLRPPLRRQGSVPPRRSAPASAAASSGAISGSSTCRPGSPACG